MTKIMVIVVDDNLINRLLPSFILRPFNTFVHVIECENGEEALNQLAIHKVTHVLLDISMPNINGIDVALKIRSIPEYSKLQLIAYTANSKNSDIAYLKSIGFDDVLVKPLQSAALLNALKIYNT